MHTNPRLPMSDRFWALVQKGDGCWLWTGSRFHFGYGQFRVNGIRRMLAAHRVSWEMHNGPIPTDMRVLHRCDNPPCVRPDHLFLGTAKDNTQDMVKKGRSARGERNHFAKLTAAQVKQIRERVAMGESQRSVAKDFGIWQPTVHYIVSGKTWRSVA